MARPKKGKESGARWVQLEDQMTNSAAWTCLSFKAVWIYIELMKRYGRETGFYHLTLPRSQVRWKMGPHTLAAGLDELVKYGFIRIVQKGGLLRQPNVYARADAWERISRDIVTREGKEAIKLGLAKKPTSHNHLANLEGRRTWERGDSRTCTVPGRY